MEAKADLHVHSKYSDRPSEWILRRVGAPESYVEPLEVYRRAKERGMQFVTVSDHNCIQGALDIAHLPDTFVSVEVTTYFPEDDCKIHCLVSGINEAQFQVIQELRENIYELQRYLVEEDIVYTCAHPLFRVNDRLTVEHFEKLLLLFNRFEGINGTRDRRASDIVLAVLESLTPEFIAHLADRHDLEPLGPTPWQKRLTAGSDDHGGLYIASAHTVTPEAATVGEFLNHLRNGNHRMAGESGASLRLAHSFYQIAYTYYKTRFIEGAAGQGNLLGELFQKLVNPAPNSGGATFSNRLRTFAGWFVGAPQAGQMSDVERVLVEEFSDLFGSREPRLKLNGQTPHTADDRHTFELACGISQQVGCAFVERFMADVARGRLIESLQTLSSLAPVGLAIAPYLAAFRTQHKDEAFLQTVAKRFPAAQGLRRRSEKKAWVTDTFSDINGVARTIHAIGREAAEQGRDLTIVTCQSDEPAGDLRVKNFTPGNQFPAPGYESQILAIPPFVEVIEYLERERFEELIISTPGPLGLTALAAANLLGMRVKGIYHSDFPLFIRHFTGDASLEKLTWRYMQWFFGQLDAVFVPSRCYQRELIDHGFDQRRLHILRRGVDLNLFDHRRRDREFWRPYGGGDKFRFLYVGRLSPEKNLDALFEAFAELLDGQVEAELAIVGDGPSAAALRERYGRPEIVFTGVLEGETLATAYASSDVFVFPSTTDTFGNAVLEAQACGLPAIVSDQGGPVEIIAPGESGIAVDAHRKGALAEAMSRLYRYETLRGAMREHALKIAQQFSWPHVLAQLWNTPDDNALADESLTQIGRRFDSRRELAGAHRD